jgi:UDP-glucose 4-epimerase
MRLLITGSRGFLGGSVGRLAAAAGHHVLGVGRSAQPPLGWLGDYAAADVATADLAPLLDQFRPDAVFHGAGTASVGDSFSAPLADLRASVLTWANVLDGVRRSDVRPVVLYPSSAAVYGCPARLPVGESAPVAPISPYGFHKAACELLSREFATCFGLAIVVCRVFSVFGPAQRRLFVWDVFRQALGSQDEVRLEGRGTESRDYLDVDDLVAAMLGLADARARASTDCGLWITNVGSAIESSVKDVATQVCELTRCGKPLRFLGKHRPGDPPHWRADTARLQSLLPGWRPTDLARGLAKCVAAWLEEQRR